MITIGGSVIVRQVDVNVYHTSNPTSPLMIHRGSAFVAGGSKRTTVSPGLA